MDPKADICVKFADKTTNFEKVYNEMVQSRREKLPKLESEVLKQQGEIGAYHQCFDSHRTRIALGRTGSHQLVLGAWPGIHFMKFRCSVRCAVLHFNITF